MRNPFKRPMANDETLGATDKWAWHFAAALLSDKGCVRSLNEDSGRILHMPEVAGAAGKGLLGVVADGMGGHQAGDTASQLTVEVICRAYCDEKGQPAERLQNALVAANRAVYDLASGDARLAGMGTTCTALALFDGLAYMAHVGDSRLYLIRGGEIYQMTEDHSHVMEMVRQGLITAEQAREHADRNVLYRALGRRAEVEISCWAEGQPLRDGDRYLLCSDGLSGVLADKTIAQMASQGDPATACASLIELTLQAGAPDNVTVGIISVSEREEENADLPSTREFNTVTSKSNGIEAHLR